MQSKIEYIEINKLIPYARNSRTHSDSQIMQIAGSIKEFGFTNPVLIDADNMIIAGHGRVMAAQKLSIKDIPCIRLGYLTEAQKKAYVIADNKIALNAGWDDQMLKNELKELESFDFDLDLLGFDDDELLEMMKEPESVNDGLTDEDSVPDVSDEKHVTKRGDVWLCGKHRVMCGDSTLFDDLEKLTNGSAADMLLTDPPYNVDYSGKTEARMKIKNDNMNNDEFRHFLNDAFTSASSFMKPGAVFYIWHAESNSYEFRGACYDAGLQIRQCLIWNKNSFVMGRQDYHWKHEPCLYGWKDGAGHLWASDRKQTTVINYDRPSKSDLHPTTKPVGLFEYQILNNTKGGDIILDLFGGSGTTLIASEKNGRVGFIMEIDEKYCDVIVKRWQEFTGMNATLESTGQTFNSLQE